MVNIYFEYWIYSNLALKMVNANYYALEKDIPLISYIVPQSHISLFCFLQWQKKLVRFLYCRILRFWDHYQIEKDLYNKQHFLVAHHTCRSYNDLEYVVATREQYNYNIPQNLGILQLLQTLKIYGN